MPRARRYACVAAMHQSAPHHCCTSAAAPFRVWDSQKGSPLPHSLASTSSSTPCSPSSPSQLVSECVLRHGHGTSRARAPAAAGCSRPRPGPGVAMASRGQAAGCLLLPPAALRWIPKPDDNGHVLCSLTRRRQGPRVRIRNNPGFQMRSQDSYE